MTKFPPPKGLSQRSCNLWREVVPAEARSAGRRAGVEAALRQLDLADQLRSVVERSGFTVMSKRSGLARINPALRAEQTARARFFAMWRQLGLTWAMEDSFVASLEPYRVGRPD